MDEREKIERIWNRLIEFFPFIVAVSMVLSAGLATDVISDYFNYLTREKEILGRLLKVAYIILFLCMAFLLYKKRNVFFRPRTRYFEYDNNPEKRKHLVLFLSNLPKTLVENNGIPGEFQLTSDIHEDFKMIERLKQGTHPVLWKWEMPLRAMQYHSNSLETVTLICSMESITQVNLFLDLCNKYDEFKHIDYYLLARKGIRNNLVYISSSFIADSFKGFDFEDFDTLSHAMWFLLRKFKQKGYKEQEIMIDITGGQKPTSIIGASMTFNLKIKLQYVQTNKPWQVVSYDVLLSSSETGGLG